MGDLDLSTVRAFVAVADNGHFGDAAAQLGITQQAVSKRIAKLESDLDAVLVSRLRTGTKLSKDGEIFLPQARYLLTVADQTANILRSQRRPFRVDVLDTRVATTELIREFHRVNPGVNLEVVTSVGLRAARHTLKAGTVDAAFARVIGSPEQDGILSIPAYLEPTQVLVSRQHPLAARRSVTMKELAGTTAWMPANVPGSEWADFYDEVSAEFGIRMDTSGPDFGYEHYVHRVSESPDMLSLVGERNLLPDHPGVVRVPVEPPQPHYLCSLLWYRREPHPALAKLIAYVEDNYQPPNPRDVWLPPADRARAAKGHEDGRPMLTAEGRGRRLEKNTPESPKEVP